MVSKKELIEKGLTFGLNEKAMKNASETELKKIVDKVESFMKKKGK